MVLLHPTHPLENVHQYGNIGGCPLYQMNRSVLLAMLLAYLIPKKNLQGDPRTTLLSPLFLQGRRTLQCCLLRRQQPLQDLQLFDFAQLKDHQILRIFLFESSTWESLAFDGFLLFNMHDISTNKNQGKKLEIRRDLQGQQQLGSFLAIK